MQAVTYTLLNTSELRRSDPQNLLCRTCFPLGGYHFLDIMCDDVPMSVVCDGFYNARGTMSLRSLHLLTRPKLKVKCRGHAVKCSEVLNMQTLCTVRK